ncbi:MAG: type IV pilin protein [Thalassotalea sp.]|nr:type IV pilin protein [Thalassotalea sp.]MDG2392499.1 type IV pilin protein [Thalassotalea sp.]
MSLNNTKNKGFTLIELMIVVAIIGIIAGIAYPSFSESIKKARRSDARGGLVELALSQSKLRGSCTTYGSTIGTENSCANGTVKGAEESENGYYTFAISGATGNAYTLTATAKIGGAQAGDTGCTEMSVVFDTDYPKGNKTPEGCW